ncbi:MAG: hypothetical protein LBN25_04580 [Christensenellaceae bacterium]|jgi:hypothetical protein|nr:hypothetical protein [Christensenellaceae bacterium]
MSKKFSSVFLRLLVVLTLVSAMCLVILSACKDLPTAETPTPDPELEDNGETVTNGTFYNAQSDIGAYTKDIITGWSKNSGATTTSANSLASIWTGVIDVSAAAFTANRKGIYDTGNMIAGYTDDTDNETITSRFTDFVPSIAPNTPAPSEKQLADAAENGTPAPEYADTNALYLSISSVKGGSAYWKNSGILIEKNKNYRLSVDVLTVLANVYPYRNKPGIIADDGGVLQGAYIRVTDGGALTEYQAIKTNGEWETVALYIEGDNLADKTIYVELWLGFGPKYLGSVEGTTNDDDNINSRLTRGFALFDNVMLETIGADEFTNVVTGENLKYGLVKKLADGDFSQIAAQSYIFPDRNFNYETAYSYTSTSSDTTKGYFGARSGAAQNWTKATSENITTAPANSPVLSAVNGTTGIFDLSKLYFYQNAIIGDSLVVPQPAMWRDAMRFAPTGRNAVNTTYRAPAYSALFSDIDTLTLNQRGQLDEYEVLGVYYPGFAESSFGYKSNAQLLVEANSYYKISVDAFVYIPKYNDGEESSVTHVKSAISIRDTVLAAYQTFNYAFDAADTTRPAKLAEIKDWLESVGGLYYANVGYDAPPADKNGVPVPKPDPYVAPTSPLNDFGKKPAEDPNNIAGASQEIINAWTAWTEYESKLEIYNAWADYIALTASKTTLKAIPPVATLPSQDKPADRDTNSVLWDEWEAWTAYDNYTKALKIFDTAIDETFDDSRTVFENEVTIAEAARTAYANKVTSGGVTSPNGKEKINGVILRLTGTSIDKGNAIESYGYYGTQSGEYDDTDPMFPFLEGRWETIELLVRGSDLADRNVNLELWYGEDNEGGAKLTVGGVYFDNLQITKLTNDEIAALSPSQRAEYKQIAAIGDESDYANLGLSSEANAALFAEYGDVIINTGSESDAKWAYELKFIDKDYASTGAVAALIKGEGNPDALIEANKDALGLTALGIDEIGATALLSQKKFDIGALINYSRQATSLTYKPEIAGERQYIEIQRNSFTKLSLFVKTEGLAVGTTVSLKTYQYSGDKDVADTELTTLAFTLDTASAWKEIQLYIPGEDTVDVKEIYLVFTIGAGNHISTPETMVKGAVFFTAFTTSTVSKSEYDGAASATYVKKIALSTAATSGIISNGDFNVFDPATYSKEAEDTFVTADDVADDATKVNGALKTNADPSSWTKVNASQQWTAYTLTTPTFKAGENPTENELNIPIAAVLDAVAYYIYVDNLEWKDFLDTDITNVPTIKNGVLIYVIEPDSDGVYHAIAGELRLEAKDGTFIDDGTIDDIAHFRYNIKFKGGKFTYRLVSTGINTTQTSFDPVTPQTVPAGCISAMSSATSTANPHLTEEITDITGLDMRLLDVGDTVQGLINYKNYLPTAAVKHQIAAIDGYDFTTLYDSAAQGIHYTSFNENVLMLASPYPTRLGYTQTISSLSAASYYEVSVWIKTVGDARASFTLNNTSKVFAYPTKTYANASDEAADKANGEYLGFVDINTADEWVKYTIFVRTTINSASFNVELYLGNKYAVAQRVTNGDVDSNATSASKTKYSVIKGLSEGVVFFDDVVARSISETQYNKGIYGYDTANDEATAKFEAEKEAQAGTYYELNRNLDAAINGTFVPGGNTAYKISELNEYQVYNNKQAILSVVYDLDSFDGHATIPEYDSTSEASKGGNPNNYTHTGSTGSTGYSSTADVEGTTTPEQYMTYGVYERSDAAKINKLVDTIIASSVEEPADTTKTTNLRSNWLGIDSGATGKDDMKAALLAYLADTSGIEPAQTAGNAFLLMANLVDNGQYYYSNDFSITKKGYNLITFYAKAYSDNGDKFAKVRLVTGDTEIDAIEVLIPVSTDITEQGYKKYEILYYNDRETDVTGNHIEFHIGTNHLGTTEDADFFKGLLLIDNVSMKSLTATDTLASFDTFDLTGKTVEDAYEAISTAFGELTAEEKAAVPYTAYTLEIAAETPTTETPADTTTPDDEDDKKWFVDSYVWLMISSIVIGAIIVAVVVVLLARKLKKKIGKIVPEKVESRVPVNPVTNVEIKGKNKSANTLDDDDWND